VLPYRHIGLISESNPICGSNYEKDAAPEGYTATHTCEVDYWGKWAPVMEWTLNDQVIQAINKTNTYNAKYTISINLNSSHNGQKINCRTYFDLPKPWKDENTHVADNIPDNKNAFRVNYTTVQVVYCEYWLSMPSTWPCHAACNCNVGRVITLHVYLWLVCCSV